MPADPPPSPPQLAGCRVLVGVSGGIAAYKTCALVSALAQRGAEVHVVMTAAATRFVAPLTFETLSGHRVITSLFDAPQDADPQHIRLTDHADLFVIAPATANIIAKIAAGLCDDALSTMVAAATCPFLIAPAMNDRMWGHPPVQENVSRLRALGYTLIGPAEGWLACRSVGPGRMVEPDEILQEAVALLTPAPPAGGSSKARGGDARR